MTVAGLTAALPPWRTLRLDGVWLALVLALAALALFVPPQALESMRFIAAALWSIAPYLLASIAIAAYAKAKIGRAHV